MANTLKDAFIFVKCKQTKDENDEFFLYNMDSTEGFNAVREKIRQAMKDHLNQENERLEKALSLIPDISIVEFAGEGRPFPAKALINVFDTPL